MTPECNRVGSAALNLPLVHFYSISGRSLIFAAEFPPPRSLLRARKTKREGERVTMGHTLRTIVVPHYIVLREKYFTSAIYYRYTSSAITAVEIIS